MSIIKSETMFDEERARFLKAVAEWERQRKELSEEGLTDDEIDAELEPLASRLAELSDQLSLYTRLREGDLSDLGGLSLGQRLIAARIARRVKSNQLADLLGVDPAQVTRDEQVEYRTASLEKLQRVARILGMRFELAPDRADLGAPAEQMREELIPPASAASLRFARMYDDLQALDARKLVAAAAAGCR